MNDYSRATAPSSLLECIDSDNTDSSDDDICPIKYGHYKRRKAEIQAERKAEFLVVNNNRQRTRSCKKKNTSLLREDGTVHIITPRTCEWFILYVESPAIDNVDFQKDFRLKFRLPYNVFQLLVTSLMEHELFIQWRSNNSDCTGVKSTPLELLLLGALRMLGRASIIDCVASDIKVSFATMHAFFRKFCTYGGTVLFHLHVKHPTSKEDLYECMKYYARMGLHGAVGSMDATHLASVRIPMSLAQAHTSFKMNNTARSYNIVVNRMGKILHSTGGFPGRWNDKTIVRHDEFYSAIMNDSIGTENVFSLYYKDSDSGKIKLQQYQGCWIIVDNGYLNVSVTVPPSKSTPYRDEMAWSNWLESVRKDVECTFGKLKGRFRILATASRLCNITQMDDVWKTCCALHNILMDHDDQRNITNADDISWEGIETLQRNTVSNMEHRNFECDLFVDENNITGDATYPNGGNIIPIKKLQLQEFKKRLVKHFAICKTLQQVHWNV